MESLKKDLNGSIQFRLGLWLSATIITTMIVTGIFSYKVALTETNELQDDLLQQVAALFSQQSSSSLAVSSHALHADKESNLIVQFVTDDPNNSQQAELILPTNLSDGLATIVSNNISYRVFVKTLSDSRKMVVSQQVSVRDEITKTAAHNAILPLIILLPLLLLTLVVVIQKIFIPLVQKAEEIDGRHDMDSQPLTVDGVPTEIQPFVQAINRLLARISASIAAQQRFISDAAHELRSPMTALSLQAESLGSLEISEEAHYRLNKLREGIERGRKLLEQLLSLSRAQSSSLLVTNTEISIHRIFRDVLEDLIPLAEAKNIDIGVIGAEDVAIHSSQFDLTTIIKNLVDNAIRYTPENGKIDLSAIRTDNEIVITIEDSGIGIAAEERERVLDPFYRILGSNQIGSGLGLSIVRTIVNRLNGRLELSHATSFTNGLKVQIFMDSYNSPLQLKQ